MKNTYIQILSSIALFSVFLSVSSCSKDAAPTSIVVPSVVTVSTTINATTTTAQSGGTITSDGGAIVTANGVCYSATNQTPTITDSKTTDSVQNAGVSPSSFVSNLTGLTANTTYYVRGYATNSVGTGYGAVVKFTTSSTLTGTVSTTVSTLAGNGTMGYIEGLGAGAQFNSPAGLTVDNKGNVYVSDAYNNVIRKITPGGQTSTIAGDGTIGFLNAATATTSEFYLPQGLAFDNNSNLFVADFGNNVIRKITSAGVVTTYVGNASGVSGYTDGTDPLFFYYNSPSGVAVDATGNVYIADLGNNVIRKVTPAFVATTLAGFYKGFINSTGSAAAFNKPNAIAVDTAGNLYIADEGNYAIRKVTSAGVVTTLVGGPSQPNLIGIPKGLALDAAGNIYISDENGRVLEYTASNVLYVLAGSLTSGVGYTDGAGASAKFNLPQGIAIDASNNIYVADKNNNAVRKIVINK